MIFPFLYKEPAELSRFLPDVAHQGIVAVAEEFSYSDLNQVIGTSLQKGGHAILVVADHITDEGNLGALIRTAAFFGVHGLIIPGDRSARSQRKDTQEIVRRVSPPAHSQCGKYRKDPGSPEKKWVLDYRGIRRGIHVHLSF